MQQNTNGAFDKILKQYTEVEYPEHIITLPFSGESITIKAMTTKDFMSIIKAFEDGDIRVANKAIDALFRKCIIEGCDDVLDMYIFDREYLLLMLKAYSKSDDIVLRGVCSQCQTDNEIKLSILELSTKSPEGTTDIFMRELPLRSVDTTIILTPPTRRKEVEIEQFLYQNPKLETGAARSMFDILFAGYLSVLEGWKPKDSEEYIPFTLQQKIKLLDVLSGDAREALEQYILDLREYGIRTKVNTLCKSCGNEIEVDVRFTQDLSRFFRSAV